jgi:hypothetical protein
LNFGITIGISIATVIIVDAILLGFAESLSLESLEQSTSLYWPGRGDWIRELLASNQSIAIGVFIVVIGGITCSLGYNIYNIFFRFEKK